MNEIEKILLTNSLLSTGQNNDKSTFNFMLGFILGFITCMIFVIFIKNIYNQQSQQPEFNSNRQFQQIRHYQPQPSRNIEDFINYY
jgi:hypothetical protein